MMAKDSLENNTMGKEYVGHFLAEVGYYLGTIYNSTYWGSGNHPNSISTTFSHYGIDCMRTDLPYTYVDSICYNNITNGYPVMVYGQHHQWDQIKSHFWVIDGISRNGSITKAYYVWRLFYPTGEPEDPDNDIWIDNIQYFTFDDGVAMGAQDNGIIMEEKNNYTDMLLFNWEYDGCGSDTEYIGRIGASWIPPISSDDYIFNRIYWHNFRNHTNQ